jgi:hypothetical protein
VMKVGYFNDLSYYLLGEAAMGLGFKDSAKLYFARARAAQQSDKSCEGAFNTCEGFEIAKAVAAVLDVPGSSPVSESGEKNK